MFPAVRPRRDCPWVCRCWPRIGTKGRPFAWRGPWNKHSTRCKNRLHAFDVDPGSALLVEESDDEAETARTPFQGFLLRSSLSQDEHPGCEARQCPLIRVRRLV